MVFCPGVKAVRRRITHSGFLRLAAYPRLVASHPFSALYYYSYQYLAFLEKL